MTKNAENTTTAETVAADPVMITHEGRKFVRFTHTFTDHFLPEEESEVSISFHFSKPTEPQIKRLQNTAGKDSSGAARNLLISTILPEQRERLKSTLEEYPGIATTFSTALIKSAGISAELGN